ERVCAGRSQAADIPGDLRRGAPERHAPSPQGAATRSRLCGTSRSLVPVPSLACLTHVSLEPIRRSGADGARGRKATLAKSVGSSIDVVPAAPARPAPYPGGEAAYGGARAEGRRRDARARGGAPAAVAASGGEQAGPRRPRQERGDEREGGALSV